MCAKALAEAGHRVLVLEKAYHFDNAALPMQGPAHFLHMLEGAGAVTSDDNSILVIAGACFGGGGTVNWSASLQTQGFVRREWSEDRGLTFFDTQEFQDCLDRVCAHMGVHDDFTPNHGNQVLLDGARKLGWLAKKVPQNTGRAEHPDGHCAQGCWSGEKKGPVNGWFPDAARAGAQFVEGFRVKRVLFDERQGNKKAVGVVGMWTSRGKNGELDGPDEDRTVREVIIKAKRVIISGGTLWSPVILKNSGLTVSERPPVNRVVTSADLCPTELADRQEPAPASRQRRHRLLQGGCSAVGGRHPNHRRQLLREPGQQGPRREAGVYFHDGRLEPLFDHPPAPHPQTIHRLTSLCLQPAYALHFLNWNSGIEFKLHALKYRHMNSYISIVRDRDPGSVYPDPQTGQPRVNYTPSAFDRRNAMVGNVATAKILYLQGALEIHVSLPGFRPFIRNEASASASTSTLSAADDDDDVLSSVRDAGVADPRFQAWLRDMEKHGNHTPETPFMSAHQMGTCRMSTSPRRGVVDPRGRVWGTQGLYVADASVFPSASGVNPMVTNMAIADWISRGVVRDLGAGGGEKANL